MINLKIESLAILPTLLKTKVALWLTSSKGVIIFSNWSDLKRLRRILIACFCVFHFLSVGWWSFPHSFEGFVLEQKEVSGFMVNLERQWFQWHRTIRQNGLFRLFSAYINLVGAHQYWDFFAPVTPRSVHFLTVCQGVEWQAVQRRIDCSRNVLYQSYDGTLEDAMQSYRGNRSRSFRFAENLVQMDQTWLDRFTDHWVRQAEAKEMIYLIDHEFHLQMSRQGIPSSYSRADHFLAAAYPVTKKSHD